MKNRTCLLFPAVAVFLQLCCGGYASAQQPPAGQEGLAQVTLQLKWKHQFQFAGYYAAIEHGYYREVGLDVTLREAVEGEEPGAAVLDGAADFGIAASDLVLLHSQGQPVVALAPIYQHSPFILLVSADSGVTNLHELAGRQLMLEPHAAELFAYFKFEGVAPERINTVPHRFGPEPLLDGEVAAMSAYSTDEPFLLQQAGVDYLMFNPRAGGIDFYGDTLFTTRNYLAHNPERVRRFLDASFRGWRYALDHPEQIADLILDKYSTRHTREHLLFEAGMTRQLILPDVVEIGYTNPGRWRHIAQTYASLGMMPRDIPLDDFIYRMHAEEAHTWLYLTAGGSLIAAALLCAAVVHYYRLSVAVRRQAATLEQALDELRVLRGIIPICCHCGKVRDNEGAWSGLESYVAEHSEAQFSHGICEDCFAGQYPQGE